MWKGAGSTRLGTCPFPRRESFAQEWNISRGLKPSAREKLKCVSLVFKITIASKRTACYSFSIIHIFLAFISTRGWGECWQSICWPQLKWEHRLTLQESTECPFEAWEKLRVTCSNVARTEPFCFREVPHCCLEWHTQHLSPGQRATGTFQRQLDWGNRLISGSDIQDVFLYNFPWVIS